MSGYEMGHFRALNEICIVAKIQSAQVQFYLLESVRRLRDRGLGAFNMTFQQFMVKGLLRD